MEDTWFHGAGDAAWNDPTAGDLRERYSGMWSTQNRLAQYKEYLNRGLPVPNDGDPALHVPIGGIVPQHSGLKPVT